MAQQPNAAAAASAGGEADAPRVDIFDSVPANKFHAHVKKQSVTIDDAYDSFDIEFDVLGELSQQPQYIKRIYVPPQSVWKKNRYMNILPHADTRVRLSVVNNDPSSDYINASHIKYICTQAPTEASVDDFWRMIWEFDTRLIVMLTKEVEKDGQKADRYWPEPQPKAGAGASAGTGAAAAGGAVKAQLKSALTGAPLNYLADPAPASASASASAAASKSPEKANDAKSAAAAAAAAAKPVVETFDPASYTEMFGEILVTMKSKSVVATDCVVRVFTLNHTRTAATREVTHFQYTGWPDHSVPHDMPSVVQMFDAYRALRASSLTTTATATAAATTYPIVTHCSAGVGRTGTFCAIDQILDSIAAATTTAAASVSATASERKQSTAVAAASSSASASASSTAVAAAASPLINVFNVIRSLRDQRPFMVQTKAQYVFVSLFLDYCLQSSLLGVRL